MVCTPININGFRGFVCGPKPRAQKCRHCGAAATLQCDGVLASGKTCDAHICARCSTPGGDDIDYCRDHEGQAFQGQLPL